MKQGTVIENTEKPTGLDRVLQFTPIPIIGEKCAYKVNLNNYPDKEDARLKTIADRTIAYVILPAMAYKFFQMASEIYQGIKGLF